MKYFVKYVCEKKVLMTIIVLFIITHNCIIFN